MGGAPWSGGSARTASGRSGFESRLLFFFFEIAENREIKKDRVKSEIGKIARKADDDTDDQYGEA